MAAIANGVWEVAGDSDWFAVELVAGQSYAVVLDGASGEAMRIQGPDGELFLFDGFASSAGGGAGHFTALTSGTYWFSASGLDAGAYSLRLAEVIDDYADNALSTGTVAVGQAATGRAEAAADSDWFGTSMVVGREYSFSVKSSGTFNIFITNADGTYFALLTPDASGRASFAPVTSGDYFVVVQEAGFDADFAAVGYRLVLTSTRLTDDYGHTPRTAGAITLTNGVGGIDAVLNHATDVDWFQVDLLAGESYRFRVSGADSGVFGLLAVVGPQGELRSLPGAFGDGTANETSFTADRSGSYYVQVSAIEGITPYRLDVARIADDYTDSALRPGSITVGGTVQALFEAAEDVDWFALQVVAGTSYSLDAQVAGGNPAYFPIANFIDGAGHVFGATFTATTTGTVYVEAHGTALRQSNTAGRYSVSVLTFADDFADNVQTAGRLAVGGTAQGNIEAMLDSDWFRVDLVAGKSYVFSATGGILAPTLMLHGPDGEAITGGDLFTARTSGSYYLAASGFIDGTYTVSAIEYADDYVDDDTTSGRFLSAPNSRGNGEMRTGDGTANVIAGGARDDYLRGNAGDDALGGGKGNDILDGGTGADTMRGGLGDDSYIVDHADDRVIEKAGQGYDTVNASIDHVLGKEVEALVLLGGGDLKGTGNALDNRIEGHIGANRLDGRDGNDTLVGGAGNDVLIGGAGIDTLLGGAGADRFLFMPDDTGATWETADRIMDFSRADRDRIVLSAIDADIATPADGAFAFIGTALFTAAGQVRFEFIDGEALIMINVDADLGADYVIRSTNQLAFTAADFVL